MSFLTIITSLIAFMILLIFVKRIRNHKEQVDVISDQYRYQYKFIGIFVKSLINESLLYILYCIVYNYNNNNIPYSC